MTPLAGRDLDVVALGEPLLEFNQVQPDPPHYLQGFGGDTSNAVIAAARAGAKTAYLSRLGQDHWASLLMQLWRKEGVDSRAVLRDPLAPTGLYFVSHDEAGHHFSYARAGSAASRMQPSDLLGAWQTYIARSQWLHVSGISMAIAPSACQTVVAALVHAKASGTRVSIDSNLRLRLWTIDQARQALQQTLPLCDLFLPSLEDMVLLTDLKDPQAILDWSHACGARTVVLKLGDQGALCSDGAKRDHIEGYAVQTVDATGAGDCFAGNLLARLAQGQDLLGAARYANAAAALSVQQYGAVAALPYPPAVRTLMEACA